MVSINNNISPPKKICQKVREPTPEPVIRRIFLRAPTPQPDIIERVIIRPQPRQIIEKITQQPRKPPPRIIEKVFFEPSQNAAIVKNSCIYVEPNQKYMYNNHNQFNQNTPQLYQNLSENYQPQTFQNQSQLISNRQACMPPNTISNQICPIMPKSNIQTPVTHQQTGSIPHQPPLPLPLPPPQPQLQPQLSQPRVSSPLLGPPEIKMPPHFLKLECKVEKPIECRPPNFNINYPKYISNRITNSCICKCCIRLKSFSSKCTATYSSLRNVPYSSATSSIPTQPFSTQPILTQPVSTQPIPKQLPTSHFLPPQPQLTPLPPQPPFMPQQMTPQSRFYAYIIVPPSQTYSILALYY